MQNDAFAKSRMRVILSVAKLMQHAVISSTIKLLLKCWALLPLNNFSRRIIINTLYCTVTTSKPQHTNVIKVLFSVSYHLFDHALIYNPIIPTTFDLIVQQRSMYLL